MVRILVTAQVEDSKEWEDGFRTHRDLFKSMTATAVRYAVTDDNEIAVCTDATDQAQGQLSAGNAAEAVRVLSQAAQAGDAEATYSLGVLYEEGTGVDQSSAVAAQFVFRALEAGSDFSRDELLGNPGAWSEPFRLETQRLLKEAGLYAGDLDGEFGPGTRSAITGLAER